MRLSPSSNSSRREPRGRAVDPPSLFGPHPLGRRSAPVRRGGRRRARGPARVCQRCPQGGRPGRRHGLDAEQRPARLRYVVNDARFVILPPFNLPNLGSHALGLTLRRLSPDGAALHGHPVLACETFVNPAHSLGTIYASAGLRIWATPPAFGARRPGHPAWAAEAGVSAAPAA